MNTLLKSILNIYNNITIVIDKQNKIIEKAYNANQTICENLNYKDFATLFCKINNLDDNGVIKLNKFLTNLLFEGTFSISVSYKSKDGEDIPYKFMGVNNDDSIVLIASTHNNDSILPYDSLTKVLNHESIIQEAKNLISNEIPFILVVMDVDDFKSFNDTYGHIYGDIILVGIAACLKNAVDINGFAGRIGGDEFLVLFKVDTSNHDLVYSFCQDLKRKIQNISLDKLKNVKITATFGISKYPSDGNTYEELFKKADSALYKGKRKGRDCFVIYDKNKELGDTIDFSTRTTKEILHQHSNNTNIISGIFELLISKYNFFEKNYTNALELIINYFLLDRVTLIINYNANSTSHYKKIICSTSSNKIKPITEEYNDDFYKKCESEFEKKEFIKIIQVKSNPTLSIYDYLIKEETSSILAFKLQYNDTYCGIIRFDMCKSNRFWHSTEISSLMLISRLFSIAIHNDLSSQQMIKRLYYDNLTNIYNYSKWRYEIDLEFKPNEPYTLIAISFNNFEKLNYTSGTKFCDNLLIELANLLKQEGEDYLYCRSSNDDFLIYTKIINRVTILNFLSLINSSIKEKANNLTKLKGGIYQGSDTLESAIDKAIFTKQIAKDHFKFYTDELFKKKIHDSQLEIHFNDALNHDEFLVFLQPKFNIITNELIGAEALSRWGYRNEGLLSPLEYIPILEASNKIKLLDYYMFKKACEFQRYAIDNNLKIIPISVNLSRYQESYKHYITVIENIRAIYDLPAELFEIEITEGMSIDSFKNIKDFISNLHHYGYKVSMDDFGMGYSNFSSLVELDVDIIKLDKSFANKTNSHKDKKVIQSIIKLAKDLNLDVISEGIETEEYRDFLISSGCEKGQGYLYDEPIPIENFITKYFK